MFFITCFSKIEENSLGWLDIGSSRTFGYYPEYQMAIDALHENRCDMHECLYLYAIVEEIGAGIHASVKKETFFKYDAQKNGFFEMEKPKIVESYTNFAIG